MARLSLAEMAYEQQRQAREAFAEEERVRVEAARVEAQHQHAALVLRAAGRSGA